MPVSSSFKSESLSSLPPEYGSMDSGLGNSFRPGAAPSTKSGFEPSVTVLTTTVPLWVDWNGGLDVAEIEIAEVLVSGEAPCRCSKRSFLRRSARTLAL